MCISTRLDKTHVGYKFTCCLQDAFQEFWISHMATAIAQAYGSLEVTLSAVQAKKVRGKVPGSQTFFNIWHYIVFTVRLHVMQRTVLLLEFCPSVRLSARCVYCDKTKQSTTNILIPHETAITLVFWHQQWLVGDAPFPLKSALKVTHPLRKTPTSTDFRS